MVLGVLADVLKPVPIYFQWRPQLSDPNDERVLECAINAQATAIVTFNERDFLPSTLFIRFSTPFDSVEGLLSSKKLHSTTEMNLADEQQFGTNLAQPT